jgi:Fe-S-cluster containining protein
MILEDGMYKRCKAYDPDAEQHCTIYATRPKACRDFPRCPMDIENKPDCGYFFVDEKGQVLKPGMNPRVKLRLIK